MNKLLTTTVWIETGLLITHNGSVRIFTYTNGGIIESQPFTTRAAAVKAAKARGHKVSAAKTKTSFPEFIEARF